MVGRSTLRGFVIAYGAFLASKVVLYAATLVLARLLAPRDFGLVGVALLVISAFDVVSDFGVPSALIYRQDIKDTDAGSAFTLGVLSGLVCFAVCFLAAPIAADLFQHPRVTLLTQVLGFTFVLSGLGATHSAILQKRLSFGRRFIPDILMAAMKGAVAVLLVLNGAGYWSLVWGQLAGTAVKTIASWVLLPWRPNIGIRWASARPLLAYGRHISAVGLLGFIIFNADYAIVGRLLGVTALGLYTLAYTIPQILTISFVVALSQVVFPTFARAQGDRAALRNTYLTVLRYSSWLLVPIGLGLYVSSPALVHLLYTPRWWATVAPMQALSLYGVIYAIGWHAGDIFKALGRPDLLWKLDGAHAVVLIPALGAGAVLGGITGVAVAHLLVAAPYSSARFWMIRRFADVDVRSIASVLYAPLLAGGALLISCLAVAELQLPSAAILGMQVVVGLTSYVFVLLLSSREARGHAERMVARHPGAQLDDPRFVLPATKGADAGDRI